MDCCFTRPAVTSRPLTSSHKMVSRMHLLHYTTCLYRTWTFYVNSVIIYSPDVTRWTLSCDVDFVVLECYLCDPYFSQCEVRIAFHCEFMAHFLSQHYATCELWPLTFNCIDYVLSERFRRDYQVMDKATGSSIVEQLVCVVQ